jgi:hypothetical protein
MTSPLPPSETGGSRRRWWIALVVGLVVVIAVVVVLVVTSGAQSSSSSTAGSDGKPVLVMTPAPGSYHNGQVISLSVGPNKYFTKYLRVVIIECADPGGQAASLPTSNATCDGNTVQSGSVLVNQDGSFSEPNYELFSLPNTVLGEPYDNEPVCNQTHSCVLYVGLEDTDFSKPKIFSAPFTIVAGNVPKKAPG